MSRFISTVLASILFISTTLELVANSASVITARYAISVMAPVRLPSEEARFSTASPQETSRAPPALVPPSVSSSTSAPNSQVTTLSSASTSKPPGAPTTITSITTTLDPNLDPEDPGPTISSNDPNLPNATTQGTNVLVPPPPPVQVPPGGTNKPQLTGGSTRNSSTELGVLFYSVFIVYVSFVKLIYHNIHFIKHNLTEQGMLMIFGIIWQLVARQISSDHNSFPHFNSRIFFYLFLPSTVLESASLLSNKWLFFNLLPILTHSIVGTVLYASSMGFTIFALGRSELFTPNWLSQTPGAGLAAPPRAPATSISSFVGPLDPLTPSIQLQVDDGTNLLGASPLATTATNANVPLESEQQHDLSNLTLADCLIFGTILSSIDSAPMLNVFKQYQVNQKLYYLVLGENLINQAVVITIFNLLIDFFETTRLTVVRIYIATLQFFANLIGAVFIGIALASFALISVRLTKRFQVPHALSSYHNQCQAMVETLLILKLAYLTYTLANLAGTSSILGLATFGILNDQYIKHNLNLRSQLAFRQVILGMKTMGFSLVYPLLGMLLVDVALTSQPVVMQTNAIRRYELKKPPLIINMPAEFRESAESTVVDLLAWDSTKSSSHPSGRIHSSSDTSAANGAPSKSASLIVNQSNLDWNYKFLATVILLTITYRFIIVIALGLIGNVLTCGQLKIKFKEQILMAYGGFKGPLSIALVHSLMEHDDHKERIAKNKHLFKYTILVNIFISAVVAGTLIRPLVARIQTTLIGRVPTSLEDSTSATIVFEQINYKLTEYVSHGLNSILGHTRSPYDKFVEFNETHIKPWLVRGDSNTNWLSVFYDNLILDETLNANCYYIATEDPTTMRVFRSERHKLKLEDDRIHHQLSAWRRRRSSTVSSLRTINENGTPTTTTRPTKFFPTSHGRSRVGSKLSNHVSLVPSVPTTRAGPPTHKVVPAVPKDRGEVLKEFVMFNLRLESARKRRQGKRLKLTRQREPPGRSSQTNKFKMIEGTSSAASNLDDSSLDRASRRFYLDQLESRLERVGDYGGFEGSQASGNKQRC